MLATTTATATEATTRTGRPGPVGLTGSGGCCSICTHYSHLLILAPQPFLGLFHVSVSSLFSVLAFYCSRYSRVIKRSKFVMYKHVHTHTHTSVEILCMSVVAFLLDCLMCQVRHYFIYQCDIGFVSSLCLSLVLYLFRY